VQAAPGGDVDAFVAVFAPGSDDVTFATYLGGAGTEFPTAIAADSSGNIYVTGVTFSSDFPTSGGALQPELDGDSDAFVVKISVPVSTTPDFALSPPAPVTATRGHKGSFDVGVVRLAGFDGAVTVSAPNTKAIKVKITPASASTSGDLVTFNYKIKKKAAPGAYPLVFTGRDASGRERSATVSLTVQ
jgi:beta-propeller repeat-containing protein